MHTKLGASFDPLTNKVQFNVFSKNASCIHIYFYKYYIGADEVLVRHLVRNGDIWSISLSLEELKNAGLSSEYLYYGYRAWGPNWLYRDDWYKGSEKGFICDVDQAGNRFNPNKLLIDPYARELSHDPQVDKIYMDPSAYINAYYGGEHRSVDTGRIAPKSVFVLRQKPIDFGIKPKRHIKDDIIYEVNVRGFTMLDDSIPENERGTFKGAGKKAGYLKKLGVTAVEFLPVQEFADEQNDDGDPRGDNYWGYMTLNYFSPNRRYSSDKSPGGPTREFKEMVRAFHDHGIKVFLDVVYNHTGEGILKRIISQGSTSSKEDIEKAKREASPSRSFDDLQDYQAACILSYAGLDNRSYYYLRDGNRRYEGRGGCGGNLNYDNNAVRNLIIDSLKYWAHEMGVDGFRFDLAPILSLTGSDGNYRVDVNTQIFRDISSSLPSRIVDPYKGVDLIAEPWGDGSLIDWTDKFPEDWSVWNRAFRDIVKISLNKYGVSSLQIGEISKVLAGSKEFIGKKPWNSINYIVSHDDCNSLRNLFSYNAFFHLDEAQVKHDQISWDQGGDIEKQKKAVRNAFALLMLSAGTPMFAGGDELFRAIPQYSPGLGRMNLVSVDNPDVYLDFRNKSLETDDVSGIFEFARNLIRFRNTHECLRPFNYFTGEINPQNGLKDITWYNEDGNEIKDSDWQRTDFIAYRINAAFENVQNESDRVESIYVAYNRSPNDMQIKFPQNLAGKQWHRVFDTYIPFCGMCKFEGNKDIYTLVEIEYKLHERSILVLVEI